MPEIAKSILAVDDDPAQLKILRQFLGGFLGADVTTSSDPEYAFELAMRLDFDLFIFDFSMPRIEGDVLYNLICVAYRHGRKPDDPPPPLLLMTGHGQDRRMRELLRLPMVRGLLSKPFTAERLVEKVTACFPDLASPA